MTTSTMTTTELKKPNCDNSIEDPRYKCKGRAQAELDKDNNVEPCIAESDDEA